MHRTQFQIGSCVPSMSHQLIITCRELEATFRRTTDTIRTTTLIETSIDTDRRRSRSKQHPHPELVCKRITQVITLVIHTQANSPVDFFKGGNACCRKQLTNARFASSIRVLNMRLSCHMNRTRGNKFWIGAND